MQKYTLFQCCIEHLLVFVDPVSGGRNTVLTDSMLSAVYTIALYIKLYFYMDIWYKW